MKFKLDENIDVRAASVLEGAGHDVATVRSQQLGGTADAVLARIVRGEGRILVTLDRGFGDIRTYPPGSHPGIVVLLLRHQAGAAVTDALRFLVGYDSLAAIVGCTVIVDARTIRVRRQRD